MVTDQDLNPTVLVQQHIDLMAFYSLFNMQNIEDQDDMILKIKVMMMLYQTGGKVWVNENLLRINIRYSNAISSLSRNPKLSVKQKKNKSIILLNSWAKLAGPMVNYPREMTLEGGGVVYISFNYFLISLIINRSIRRHITEYMHYSTELDYQKEFGNQKRQD